MATMIKGKLFDNGFKVCAECHRDLMKEYKGDVCPICEERLLFSKVKDYIRAQDVTEFDVSNEFDISLSKIKDWIREGRIEYKELKRPSIRHINCQQCGKSISFGSLCAECLRKANISGNATLSPDSLDEKIRFLQK